VVNSQRKALFAGIVVAFAGGAMLAASNAGQAFNDNNVAQDEKEMIRIGLEVAASAGIQLDMRNKDPDMIGLGSYVVNVVADCNGCHTHDPATEFLPTGNPYLRQPPEGPFLGAKQINPATDLGGGQDFGAFPSPNGAVHIVSRNLTPDKTGLPEGAARSASSCRSCVPGPISITRNPNCPTNAPQCLLPPFNGDVLQVMPWPTFQGAAVGRDLYVPERRSVRRRRSGRAGQPVSVTAQCPIGCEADIERSPR
jgi:hypothetical protein